MNIDELRASFTWSERLVERIRTFRLDRIKALEEDNEENELPLRIPDGVKLSLHVIPLSLYDLNYSVDLSCFRTDRTEPWLRDYTSRYFNFDGVLIKIEYGYMQIFRNGVIECVTVYGKWNEFFYLAWVQSNCLDLLRRALGIQQQLRVTPPIVVMLSLLGTKSIPLKRHPEFLLEDPRSIKRNKLLFPDVLVNSYSDNTATIMKPIFDMAYQAGGWPASIAVSMDHRNDK